VVALSLPKPEHGLCFLLESGPRCCYNISSRNQQRLSKGGDERVKSKAIAVIAIPARVGFALCTSGSGSTSVWDIDTRGWRY